jgi:hypothetical protein
MENSQKGYSLIAVLTLLVVIAALVIGSMFALQRFDFTAFPSPTPQPPSKLNTTSKPAPPSTKEVSPDKGIIEGTFSYPSEKIPDTLIPCAENTDTKDVICSASYGESGQSETFLIIVPPGSYYVYAINTEDSENYKAYYTEFVTCGLEISCPSHDKIAVTVEAQQTVSGIKPHDWYDR